MRGPVLNPPCIRQRRFPRTAGDRQIPPRRVRAPQRGAFEGSPEGFPFFRRPLSGPWGGGGADLHFPLLWNQTCHPSGLTISARPCALAGFLASDLTEHLSQVLRLGHSGGIRANVTVQ